MRGLVVSINVPAALKSKFTALVRQLILLLHRTGIFFEGASFNNHEPHYKCKMYCRCTFWVPKC